MQNEDRLPLVTAANVLLLTGVLQWPEDILTVRGSDLINAMARYWMDRHCHHEDAQVSLFIKKPCLLLIHRYLYFLPVQFKSVRELVESLAFPEPLQSSADHPTDILSSITTYIMSIVGVKVVNAYSLKENKSVNASPLKVTQEGLEGVKAVLQEGELAVIHLGSNFEVMTKKSGGLYVLSGHTTAYASPEVWRKLSAKKECRTPHDSKFKPMTSKSSNRSATAAAAAFSPSSFIAKTLKEASSTWEGMWPKPGDAPASLPTFGVALSSQGNLDIPVVGAEREKEAKAGKVFISPIF